MRFIILLLLVIGVANAQAETVTLDFDGLITNESSFQVEGYNFSTSGGFFAAVPIAPSPSVGVGLAGPGPFEMAQDGGGVFSIYSLDLYGDSVGDALTVTGYLQGGGELSTTFTLAATSTLTTFNFGSEWQSLASISMVNINTGGSPLVVDNIVVSAVPVPAAVWLFGSALAGLGWLRRKQAV